MQTITDYIVVTGAHDLEAFVKEVKELIKKGWQPLGGPYIHGGCMWGQAMVKYSN
jgi:hypothetical protein